MIEEPQRDDNPERGTRRVPRSVIVALALVSVAAIGAAVFLGIAYRTPPEEPVAVVEDDSHEDSESAPFTITDDGSAAPDVASEPAEAPAQPTQPALTDETDSEATEQSAAPAEEPLATLQVAPPDAVAMIMLPEGFESASFRITFSPHGWGPGGPTGRNLIISVDSMEPSAGDVDGIEDQTGKVLSVWVVEGEATAVPTGGTYAGVLEVRKQGDLGWLFLGEISKG